MMHAGGRRKPEQLSLSLRRVTRRLHDVSEERFDTLSRMAPGKVAGHLATLTQTLFVWHDERTGTRTSDNVPRILARAMADHRTAIEASSGALPRPLPSALARFSLDNRGEAIGGAYTLCGAALGLRPALRVADLTAPAERDQADALAAAGGAMYGRWRGIRMAIDRWGLEHPDLQADVLAGACTAFCVALTILDAMVEQNAPEASDHA